MLNETERAFLCLLEETMYANPFSVDVATLNHRFSGFSGYEESAPAESGEHYYAGIAQPLKKVLAGLNERGVTRFQQLHGQDSERLKNGLLFLAYHNCTNELDRHIEAQLASPSEPVPVAFAPRVLQELERCGFGKTEALRYFGFFFQLRRAYYFIDRALVGQASSMQRLRRGLWNLLFTEDARLYDRYLWDRMEDFSTLLLGETGTGKGAAAAAIGRSGFIPFSRGSLSFKSSFTQTFIATNLSQYSENLIESELFGHRKGAFTGAIDNHKGLFERCSRYGSLFLDEVGDVSVAVQIKLLKVLQERRFVPVGSHDERRFSGRIIAATNRSLADLWKAGEFRSDFYYRVSSLVLQMPSLRQRLRESSDELALMIRLLLRRILGRDEDKLVDQVRVIIEKGVSVDYPWPGNVRELEQVIRRTLLSQRIDRELMFTNESVDHTSQETLSDEQTAKELLSCYCGRLFRRYGTYEAVARHSGLDRRTVKKYIEAQDA